MIEKLNPEQEIIVAHMGCDDRSFSGALPFASSPI